MGSKIIKRMIFAFSFIMFCYQAKIAISKLQNPTVMDVTEKLDITDIQQPLITICPKDQFDYSGKVLRFPLLMGFDKADGSLGWGVRQNMTFEQLKKQIYAFDFDTISIRQETQQGFKEADYEIRFYPKFGWCFDISNYTISEEVHLDLKTLSKPDLQLGWKRGSKLTSEVFLTDTNLRTMSTVHTLCHWGSDIVISRGWTTKFVVKVEQLSSFDPLSPGSCREYSHGMFERCVDKELQKVWKPHIKCNPPWVSPQDQCTGLQKASNATFQELMKEPHDTTVEILDMKTYAAKGRCTKSCTLTRSTILSNGKERKTFSPSAFLKIKFDNFVIKHTKVLGYNFSDFLIDMGSSLGLWFGLSVFGILDLVIIIMQWMKNFKNAMM